MSLNKPWHHHDFSPMELTPNSCKVCGAGNEVPWHSKKGAKLSGPLIGRVLKREPMEVFHGSQFSASRPSCFSDAGGDQRNPQGTDEVQTEAEGVPAGGTGVSDNSRAQDGRSDAVTPEVPLAPRVEEDELPQSTNEDNMLDHHPILGCTCNPMSFSRSHDCPVHRDK